MDGQLISLIEIADAHGKRRQSVHKLVNRLGMITTKRKSSKARGQAISYIAAANYEELKRHMGGSVDRSGETVSDGSRNLAGKWHEAARVYTWSHQG